MPANKDIGNSQGTAVFKWNRERMDGVLQEPVGFVDIGGLDAAGVSRLDSGNQPLTGVVNILVPVGGSVTIRPTSFGIGPGPSFGLKYPRAVTIFGSGGAGDFSCEVHGLDGYGRPIVGQVDLVDGSGSAFETTQHFSQVDKFVAKDASGVIHFAAANLLASIGLPYQTFTSPPSGVMKTNLFSIDNGATWINGVGALSAVGGYVIYTPDVAQRIAFAVNPPQRYRIAYHVSNIAGIDSVE